MAKSVVWYSVINTLKERKDGKKISYCCHFELVIATFAGSGDIVEGNLKLILGLIWTLILHYQISIGFNLDDDGKGKKGPTPKQALMGYVQVSLSTTAIGSA